MSVSNPGLRRPRQPEPAGQSPKAEESTHQQPQQAAAPETRPMPTLPAVRDSGRDDTIEVGHLPPLGLLLARPLLLALCALVGAGIGFAVTGNGGYQAQAVLEFTAPGTDNVLVKQAGQTIARNATSGEVVQSAQVARGQADGDLADRVTASWEQDTKLVSITVTADSVDAAIDDANAVAEAVVRTSEASIATQLASARNQSNEVLNSEQLDSKDAEAARRAQLGNSLAARQDAIASQSGDLLVADPANQAKVSGLTKAAGTSIGLVAGLLVGGLISLLLGLRGLRAGSERNLRYLVPDAELSSPSQAAQIAGQIIESRRNSVAVVATPGAEEQATNLAKDVAEFLRAHGKTVAEIGPIKKGEKAAALTLLRRDVRGDLESNVGADIMVVVVAEGSEGSALLEGQSNLRALIVVRRRRTLISSALRVMKAYERANPVLVLAR